VRGEAGAWFFVERCSQQGALIAMTKPDEAPAWDGRPENPEERARHWLSPTPTASATLFTWVPTKQMWRPAEEGWEDEIYSPAEMARWHYQGPLLLPAEARRLRGEFRRGWEAGREAAALIAMGVATKNNQNGELEGGGGAEDAATAIRAMEPPA
jgi:hypothetical protein